MAGLHGLWSAGGLAGTVAYTAEFIAPGAIGTIGALASLSGAGAATALGEGTRRGIDRSAAQKMVAASWRLAGGFVRLGRGPEGSPVVGGGNPDEPGEVCSQAGRCAESALTGYPVDLLIGHLQQLLRVPDALRQHPLPR